MTELEKWLHNECLGESGACKVAMRNLHELTRLHMRRRISTAELNTVKPHKIIDDLKATRRFLPLTRRKIMLNFDKLSAMIILQETLLTKASKRSIK